MPRLYWNNLCHDPIPGLAFFALQHMNESRVQVISYRWGTTAVGAQKQSLFGPQRKLLPDKLELCMSNEACCVALAGKVCLTPVSQYDIKLVKVC